MVAKATLAAAHRSGSFFVSVALSNEAFHSGSALSVYFSSCAWLARKRSYFEGLVGMLAAARDGHAHAAVRCRRTGSRGDADLPDDLRLARVVGGRVDVGPVEPEGGLAGDQHVAHIIGAVAERCRVGQALVLHLDHQLQGGEGSALVEGRVALRVEEASRRPMPPAIVVQSQTPSSDCAHWPTKGYCTMPLRLERLGLREQLGPGRRRAREAGLGQHRLVVEEELRVVQPGHAVELAVVFAAGEGGLEDARREARRAACS